MKPAAGGMVNNLDARFAEAERRVRDLADENRRLRARLRELEQEAAAERDAVRELEQLRGRQGQVRARLERILAALEAVEIGDEEAAGAPGTH